MGNPFLITAKNGGLLYKRKLTVLAVFIFITVLEVLTSKMALNGSETPPSTNSSAVLTSVVSCVQEPNTKWDLNYTTRLGKAVVISAASPLTVLFNTLVMIILKKREVSVQRRSNILLFSLAITDLLVGAICMPLDAITDIFYLGQFSLVNICKINLCSSYIFNIFISASVIHQTMIAWERYLAMRKWMDYKNIATKSRLKKLATLSWLFAIFLGFPIPSPKSGTTLLFILDFVKGLLNLLAVICFPVLILYFYLMVYLGIRKRKKSIVNQVTAMAKLKFESKVTKTCAMITFALFIAVAPEILSLVFSLIASPEFMFWLSQLSDMMLQLNSLFTPLIYWLTDNRYWNALLDLLKIKRPQAIQPANGVIRELSEIKNDQVREPDVVQKQRIRSSRSASCSGLPSSSQLNDSGTEGRYKRRKVSC